MPFFSISETAQNFAHNIGKGGTRQGSEWYWTDKVDRGEAQPRREETIEHALTEPRRQFGRYAVS